MHVCILYLYLFFSVCSCLLLFFHQVFLFCLFPSFCHLCLLMIFFAMQQVFNFSVVICINLFFYCLCIYLFIFLNKFIYLSIYFWVFVAACRLFSSCGERGLLFIALCRLLIAVAFLVAEHRL